MPPHDNDCLSHNTAFIAGCVLVSLFTPSFLSPPPPLDNPLPPLVAPAPQGCLNTPVSYVLTVFDPPLPDWFVPLGSAPSSIAASNSTPLLLLSPASSSFGSSSRP